MSIGKAYCCWLRRIAVVSLWLLGVAHAAHGRPGLGVRAYSLGQAYRSIATDGEAVLYNPAGLVCMPRFAMQGNYAFSFDGPIHDAGIMLVDSKTIPLAVGLSYFFDAEPRQFFDEHTFAHLAILSLAYPIVSRNLGLGVNLSYRNLPKPDGSGAWNKVSLDVGLTMRFSRLFSLAAVGYNLIPTRLERVPMGVGLGLSSVVLAHREERTPLGVYNGLTLAIDWALHGLLYADSPENNLSVGAEYLLLMLVPLRAGYEVTFALKKTHRMNFGTGIAMGNLGLDLLYGFVIGDIGDSIIGFSLQFAT
ncbi:MAG: hypothetical protein AAF310_02995 [Myxococcota bacterium]